MKVKNNRKIIFKCPYCGSTNVSGWVEGTYIKQVKLKQIPENDSYISQRKTSYKCLFPVFPNERWGYECNDCGECCNEFDESASEWRIKGE